MTQPLRPANLADFSLHHLASQRQRLGIWVSGACHHHSNVARTLASDREWRYVNALDEIVTQLTDDADKPLGVFGPDDLAHWLLRQSHESKTGALLVDDIEPLFGTFGRLGTIAFFRRVASLGPRTPVIIISCLADLVSAAGFPAERTWSIVI